MPPPDGSTTRLATRRLGRNTGTVVEPQADLSIISVERINAVLATSASWPHGAFTSIEVERIGSEFGLSGRAYRVAARVSPDTAVTLVAKIETVDAIGREVAFRAANERDLASAIPAAYGSVVDQVGGWGLILMEDIGGSEQGDVLGPRSTDRSLAIVELIGSLHGRTLMHRAGGDTGVEQWQEQVWENDRWEDRIARGADRYTGVFLAPLIERLRALPEDFTVAIAELSKGAQCWIHRDPHLDNALWRLDGSLVLLDWSGAVIGPPSVDVAVLLLDHAFSTGARLEPAAVLSGYRSARERSGAVADPDQIERGAAMGLLLAIRGVIGWSGRQEESPPTQRMFALRDQALLSATAALRWIDGRR